MPRWQRAAQHADTWRTTAGRAVETAPSSGPRRYINFDSVNFLSWEVVGSFGYQGAAAESDGADGDADDSSAVVHRERADWERGASRRAVVGLVQAGDGPGLEGAPADSG